VNSFVALREEMVMKDLLKGDVAVVTGGAQGNGRALALGLARYGAKVAVGDVNEAGAKETADEIAKQGGEAIAFALDVTDRAQCLAVPERVHKRLGTISILINNAGIVRRGVVQDEDFMRNWDATFSVNVDGCINMVSALLPDLARTKGRILNLGSIMSYVSGPKSVAYSSTKGAILQMTKALAIELAPQHIRVNGIAPGVIATPMTEVTRSNPDAISKFLAHTPMGRVGEAEELVGPVIFLVSTLSSYVTGTMLPVDGGYLAN
jgi:NAD(P)-dependent dehydrogenase (short-subunit alcohol dehydrogenase family)